MRIAFALTLIVVSLYYGYELIPHPDRDPGKPRLGDRTRQLPKVVQLALAFLAWVCFTSGIWLFATRGG